MTNKEKILAREKERGRQAALLTQENSSHMTGTELNASDTIPLFREAIKKQNMLTRKAGLQDGFICRTSSGRVARLIQNYNSEILTSEPEFLTIYWRFIWSTDPAKAFPFVALATSPYNTGEYCLNSEGIPFASIIDNNIQSPDAVPQYWKKYEEKK